MGLESIPALDGVKAIGSLAGLLARTGAQTRAEELLQLVRTGPAWLTNTAFMYFCLRIGHILGPVKENQITAIDTSALPWEPRWNEHLGKTLFRKNLIEDPETGAEIRLVRYPAGVINTRHVHTCAHGMYVVQGTLLTHAGAFGPGHFVWFPAGIEMEHGATAEADVTVLFITNRKFDIHYLPPD